MQWHDIQQNTPEWFDLRKGKVTGSGLCKVMANEGKAFGDPAKRYALQLALERVTGKVQENGYSNAHMERGHEQEPLARRLYEETYFCNVGNGGFFEDGNTGSSPDGLVGSPGMIEIKSVIAGVHYANIKRGGIDPAYKWQCYGSLKITRREWLDFVSFCSEFPEGKQLYVHRIFAKDCADYYARIDSRVCEFEFLVRDIIKDLQ